MTDPCKYGSSGDTCGPVMNYDRCICRLEDQIESLRNFAKFIIDGYPRVDIDHKDFRVQAYQNALLAMDMEAPELALMKELGLSHKTEKK